MCVGLWARVSLPVLVCESPGPREDDGCVAVLCVCVSASRGVSERLLSQSLEFNSPADNYTVCEGDNATLRYLPPPGLRRAPPGLWPCPLAFQSLPILEGPQGVGGPSQRQRGSRGRRGTGRALPSWAACSEQAARPAPAHGVRASQTCPRSRDLGGHAAGAKRTVHAGEGDSPRAERRASPSRTHAQPDGGAAEPTEGEGHSQPGRWRRGPSGAGTTQTREPEPRALTSAPPPTRQPPGQADRPRIPPAKPDGAAADQSEAPPPGRATFISCPARKKMKSRNRPADWTLAWTCKVTPTGGRIRYQTGSKESAHAHSTDASSDERHRLPRGCGEGLADFLPRLHSPTFPARIVNISSPVTVNEGGNVNLLCLAVGRPEPTVTWRQLRDGFTSEGEILEISDIQRGQAGEYECVTHNGVNSAPDSRRVLVTVNYPPTITDVTSARTALGRAALLRCEAMAVPPADFQWYKDDRLLSGGAAEGLKVQTERTRSMLLFANVSARHYGNYTCRAANRLGASSASMRLLRPGSLENSAPRPPGPLTLLSALGWLWWRM
ncbi:igLON family member 5 [Tupaia chinensis]|uniref:igLON family member 5 n=1 Tax=Tupaia chinensis TaxID=246437 RepID=UPI000FFB4B47|nr:igLON family member 5 [Tupaia chinensis]